MKELRVHFLTAVLSGIGFLLYQFISSLVTTTQLQGMESKFQEQTYLNTQKVERLEGKVDLLRKGLCIIDERTCKLEP